MKIELGEVRRGGWLGDGGFTGLGLGKVLAFPPKRSLDGAPRFVVCLGRATRRDLIHSRPSKLGRGTQFVGV
jgi:hypothetical protein